MNICSINGGATSKHFLKKMIIIMKLSVVLCLLTTFCSFAAESYAQKTDISLHLESVTLQEAFTAIKTQTDFSFWYRNDEVNLEKRVSINANKQNIYTVMNQLLRGQDLKYVINEKHIIIYKSDKAETGLPQQQNGKRITGIVIDSKGEPVIGANVVVKGTTNGTMSDTDGKFILTNIKKGDVLEITYIGYISQNIRLTDESTLKIELKENSQALDEVVVVGYGTQKKINLTGSITSVNVEKVIESRPITNISNGLAGLAPGLYVNSGSNDPGSNASLLVRGQGTLNNSAPLVLVDGVESNIGFVAPQDVANISVLKDAASSAIYGSRAANGVILITTKQGEAGKVRISYDGYLTLQSVINKIPMVDNSVEYMELINEAYGNSGMGKPFSEANIQDWRDHQGDDPILWPNSNWMDAVFRTAVTSNHTLSVTAGTEKVKTYASFNFENTPGIIEKTGMKKQSFRSNTDIKPTKWLDLGMNLNGVLVDKSMGSSMLGTMFTNSIICVPTVVIRTPDGRYGGQNNSEDNQYAESPLAYLNSIRGENKTYSMKTRFFGTITPLKGLSINGSYNYEFFMHRTMSRPHGIDRWNFQTNTILVQGKPSLYISYAESKNVRNMMDGNITYEHKFFDDNLYFKILGGSSQEQFESDYNSATKQGLIDQDLTQLDAANGEASASGYLSDWSMRSYFGRLNLSWADKYLVELNIRRDGSSRFRSNNRWGNFPSVSVGWRISEEPFMKSFKGSWLQNLKVRASYGSLGNNSVGNYESISTLGFADYVLNNTPTTGFAIKSIANGNLTWESTYVTDIGLDFNILNNRLSAVVDYYNKQTKNILIDLPAPYEHGATGIPTQNSASVRNRGFEVTLGWQDKINDFSYYANANLAFNKNKVTKYKGDEYTLSGTNMIKEGYPINVQYVRLYDRIVQTDADLAVVQSMVDNAPVNAQGNKMNPFSANGKPVKGDILYKDINGDGLINDNDRTTVGHGLTPTTQYSATLGCSYKRVDFSVFFQGISGLKRILLDSYYTPVLSRGNIVNKEIADGRWYEGRTNSASYPRLLTSNSKNTVYSDFWLQNMSYLKIKNIQIGYTVPTHFLPSLNISKLRVYASLENFFTFTSYKGIDPEVSGMNYPTMKQAVFGINLSF